MKNDLAAEGSIDRADPSLPATPTVAPQLRRPYAAPAIEHTGALEAVTLATTIPQELGAC